MSEVQKPKLYFALIHFFVGGIIAALIFWAWDSTEGKPFDLLKFLIRIVIFGAGNVLAFYIGSLAERKKPRSGLQ